jgi:ankyrin repeat protein
VPICRAAMSAAGAADPRSLWLNSPDALLQVMCVVAMNGHDARNFSSLSRAFRGDEVLWGCIKDRRGPKGRTALMACSERGDLVRVRWLLDRCADVNATQTAPWYKGTTSLMLASKNGHLAVVRELLARGASVNAERTGLFGGYTALVLACIYGHLEVVRELLEFAADVNALTAATGWTSLMYVCSAGHLEIARIIVAHNASKTSLNAYGQTAYELCAGNAELRALVKP